MTEMQLLCVVYHKCSSILFQSCGAVLLKSDDAVRPCKCASWALCGSFDGNRIDTPQVSFHICKRVQCDTDVTLFGESADGFLLSTTLLVVSPQTVPWRGHVHSLVLRLLISQQPPSRSPPPNPKAPWEDNRNQWYVYGAIRCLFPGIRVYTQTRAIPLAGLTGDGRERRRRAADGEGSLQLQPEQRGRAVVQQRRHDRGDAAGGRRLVGGHAQRQNRLVSQQLRPRDQTVRWVGPRRVLDQSVASFENDGGATCAASLCLWFLGDCEVTPALTHVVYSLQRNQCLQKELSWPRTTTVLWVTKHFLFISRQTPNLDLSPLL